MTSLDNVECQRCNSERIVYVNARAKSLHTYRFHNYEHEGYALDDLGIGGVGGDETEFEFCLDCGQIQGLWPLKVTSLEKDHWECPNCGIKFNTEDDEVCQSCDEPKPQEVID